MNIKIAIIITILFYIKSSFIISEDDFLEHNLNIILDTDNFNNLAILKYDSKQYTLELEESDKSTDTYIYAILPNGKIIEEALKDKKNIIKKLSN